MWNKKNGKSQGYSSLFSCFTHRRTPALRRGGICQGHSAPSWQATVRTQVCWCPGAHIHAPTSNPTEPGLLPTTCVCIYPGFPSKCRLQMPFQSIKQLNYFPKFNLMVWCQLTAGCGFPVSESRIIFILGFRADGSITVVGAREGLDEHARFVHKADLQRSVIRLSSALKTAGLNDTLAFSWFQTGWTL